MDISNITASLDGSKMVVLPYVLSFITILAKLCYWSIIAWVVSFYLVLFGILTQNNPLTKGLDDLVRPILRPFRFAKIGMFDLSPILAILTISFVSDFTAQLLLKLMAG